MKLLHDENELIKGEIADYYFDREILYAYSKSILRTVELIDRNVALVKSITNNQVVPLLIYLVDSPIPDKATRRFSTQKLPEIYSAMAMVAQSGLSLFIMNLLFKMKKTPIPMKSFTDDKEAKIWLTQFL